jgi:hypothetical protein
VRLALRVGAHAICEKPLVISPWNLDQLAALEQESGRRVYTVLQLRMLPALVELARSLEARRAGERADVELTYITSRGPWYGVSWKGVAENSGGLALNIGVHFFDVLIWLYGKPLASSVFVSKADKMSGVVELERARVRWFLSLDRNDLPETVRAAGKNAFRSLTSNGEELDLSEGFVDLHTAVYRDVLAGHGFSIEDVPTGRFIVRAYVSSAVDALSAPVDLAEGQSVEDVLLVLPEPCWLEGRIALPTGASGGDVCVAAVRVENGDSPDASRALVPLIADVDVEGRFRVGPAVAGTWDVWASPGHGWQPMTFDGEGWDGAPAMATEWNVEARAGGVCVVRIVYSMFASTDDWDDQMEGGVAAFAGFLRTLRLYLTHFRGERSEIAQLVALSARIVASPSE